MILYKYMSKEVLNSFLENETLRFTNPKFFNDPFDCEISCVGNSDESIQDEWFNEAKILRYISQIGILCLTRNKLNLLMWAHYAKEHKGAVIGIDTELAELNCLEKNLVTAAEGSVIYTSLRPSSTNHNLPYAIRDMSLVLREKLFLHKSIHWAYEEEVRIVREFSGYRHDIYDAAAEDIRYEDFKIPTSAIKEIIFGSKFEHPIHILTLANRFPTAKVSRCFLDKKSWTIEETPLSKDVSFT